MEPKIPDQGIVPNSAERFSIESVGLCFANPTYRTGITKDTDNSTVLKRELERVGF